MKQKPNFIVKPKFVPNTSMVQALAYGVIGAICGTFAFGVLLTLVFTLLGFGGAAGTIFTGCFLLGIIGIPLFFFEFKRKNYKATYFKFYDDWIDFSYFSGPLMNRRKGRLYYVDISDMVQNSNFLQRFGNLKTIEIHAPGTGLYERGQNFIGIALTDVEIGKGAGEKIQDILQRTYDGAGFPADDVPFEESFAEDTPVTAQDSADDPDAVEAQKDILS